ncbi:MAG TPA: MFS transporter [Candidatus Polarisedimenticolia bacterium]|nr:MFS transporter [Candidatus Polarisedimenticolia bacterium]
MIQPPTKLELWSWCLYDFANSAFPTLITTVAYSVYFTQVVAGGGPGASLLWSLAISASMILIGAVSPLLGAIADHSASKKKWLFWFTVSSIVPTALLFTVGPGDIVAGTVLFVLANLAWAGGNGIYNGFLSELTDDSNVGRLSGYGYALGYLGGLIALAVCLPLLTGGFGPENRTAFSASFLVTAAFFAVCSLPTFLWLRERAVPHVTPGVSPLRAGYARLVETFHRVRRLKELFKFLGAFLIYNDGIETVIYFSSIYAVSVLGFTMGETVYLFMAVQVTALVGSLIFGHVTDRIGARPTIVVTLLLWCGVVTAAFLVTGKGPFWIIALTAGIGLGSNQAASRGLMRQFVPRGRDAEFYGFFAVCGKFSALLGPLVYGVVARVADSHRMAILSVLVFFVAGLLLLMTVDVPLGRRGAAEFRET